MDKETANKQIESLIKNLGQDFNVLKYVYNKKFVPGETTVYYSGPYWDHEEITEAIKTLILGDWLSAGENVDIFEKEFCKKFNQKKGIMVNSGSSADLLLIAALKKVLGWKDGDEVILSVVGFPTTLSALMLSNLNPVLIDIEFDTLNFDLNLIEQSITEKTKAIFLSPVLGNTCDMDKLLEICKKHNLELILDNCDSLGSKWKGKYLNEYAIASANSFYPAHHITTGEGGLIFSNDWKIIRTARSMAWWGRDCHTAGTSIYTNNGVKNIEDIKIGDFVYTHLGNYKNVNDLIRKKYTGQLHTFESMRNENVTVTANHPLFINRNRECMWVLAKDIFNGDFLVQKVPKKINTPPKFHINYKTLIGEKNFDIKLEPDLFRLIGYWLAEGSLANGKKGINGKGHKKNDNLMFYRVDFIFNVNEKEYISDVISLMKKYFNVTHYIRENNNGASLTFKTRKGYEFFQKYCNKLSYNKILPYKFIHYDKKFLKELIIGFWRGDGTNDFQSVSISTCSKNLINQFRMILSRFGISPGLEIRKPENHKSAIVRGKLIQAKHNLYTIKCYGENAKKFSKLLSECYPVKKEHYVTKYFTSDNEYTLHEITGITMEDVENLDVFNFEVDDDHSYHANGIASHNCVCVGSQNILPNGICNNRFSAHLPCSSNIMDHKYVFTNIGYNLKPLDLQGSIGQVQLKKFDEIHERRLNSKNKIQAIFEKYIPEVKIINQLEHAETSWFGTPVICDNNEIKTRLVSYLEKNKIQTRNYFAGNILMHPAYQHLGDYKDFSLANKVLDQVFFLGASPHYDDSVFEYIEEVVKNFKA